MRRWLYVLASVAVVLALIAWMAAGPLLSPHFEAYVREALGEYFGGEATFRTIRVTFFPRPAITGEGIVVRHRGRSDVPPLVEVQRFTTDATWIGLLSRPRAVHCIELEGLRIHIPPRPEGEPLLPEAAREGLRKGTSGGPGRSGEPPVIVREVRASGARLAIQPREAWKPPRIFDIHELRLADVALDRPMRFTATLTNPKPPGPIQAEGTFGPWASGEASDTPISGKYTFRSADLGVFTGIDGDLDSTGTFSGMLGRIAVKGTTDTPNFTLRIAGNPVHLRTTFHAIVDGTNGNTWLQPVEASFLESVIRAHGAVVRTRDERGREVALDVVIEEARIEDLLQLAVKGKGPLMTGRARIETKLRIPPGEADVADKLELDGSFHIAEARFTSVDVQQSLATLSRRGRGLKDAALGGSVVSDLQGRFRLRDGRLRFSSLRFAVPGAVVHLNGSYGLRDEELAFRGSLRLRAKLSQTVSGFKSVLLKLVDPFFRKNGAGAELPIKIEGPRERPKFGLDAKKLLPGV